MSNEVFWKKGDTIRLTLEFESRHDSESFGRLKFVPEGFVPDMITEVDPDVFEVWEHNRYINMSELARQRGGKLTIEKIADKKFEFPTEAGSVVKAGGLFFMLDEDGNWGNLDGQWSEKDIIETAEYVGEQVELIH